MFADVSHLVMLRRSMLGVEGSIDPPQVHPPML
jgi:hypothetical protein